MKYKAHYNGDDYEAPSLSELQEQLVQAGVKNLVMTKKPVPATVIEYEEVQDVAEV